MPDFCPYDHGLLAWVAGIQAATIVYLLSALISARLAINLDVASTALWLTTDGLAKVFSRITGAWQRFRGLECAYAGIAEKARGSPLGSDARHQRMGGNRSGFPFISGITRSFPAPPCLAYPLHQLLT
jgi:hypothetical protein